MSKKKIIKLCVLVCVLFIVICLIISNWEISLTENYGLKNKILSRLKEGTLSFDRVLEYQWDYIIVDNPYNIRNAISDSKLVNGNYVFEGLLYDDTYNILIVIYNKKIIDFVIIGRNDFDFIDYYYSSTGKVYTPEGSDL